MSHVSDTARPVDPRSLRRYRRFQFLAAFGVLAFAFAVVAVGWAAPDPGFQMIHGGQVTHVEPEGPADRAGLLAGDAIEAVNGQSVDGALARARAVRFAGAGERLDLVVSRGGEVANVGFTVGRAVPLSSVAGLLLAALLMALALFADRGVRPGHPRTFFRATLVYVIFATGAFSLELINHNALLFAVWIYVVNLAAPVTCHQMLQFPLGPEQLSKRVLVLLYAVPLLLATLIYANHLAFLLGFPLAAHGAAQVVGGVAVGTLALVYLAIGAVARYRRLRKNPGFDPVAARWLKLGSAFMLLPWVVGVFSAMADPRAFVSAGYKPLVAITVVGGVLCAALAMSRVSIGQLDVLWRRSSGYVLATGLAIGLYLAVIAGLGGIASTISGGDFRSALAATLVAAVVFGPLRFWLQRTVDIRFGRDRARARRLLREATEEAGATLDIHILEGGLVKRVREALRADGAALYVEKKGHDGWLRQARDGTMPLPRDLESGDALGKDIVRALRAKSAVELEGGAVVAPIAISDGEPAALIVIPEAGACFDEEARDHLYTAGANFSVAIRNARAHTRVRDLNQRLKNEVKIAEERRQEIVRLKERLEEENRELIGQLAARTGRSPVIGQGLRSTFELVQKVARTETSVLVRGETGVGKELVARAVHAGSGRRDGPFVVVDCGAISPGLFESTLFGHVRGAFTGAVRDAQGAFRSANGGTIFLDEIGELPADLQPKLLRVLQERDVQAVGGDKREPINVRVIAGTNRDLAKEVDLGTFRQDLLYRLRVVEVVVPPLRERLGDIEALAEHFLAASGERAGKTAKRLAPDALGALLEYDWPGNVRELEHTLEAALVYAEGEEIRAPDLPIFDQLFQQRGRRAMAVRAVGSEGGGAPRAGLREALEGLERERLEQALGQHGGNKTQTAKALGISRGALLRRLKRYGLMA